MNSTWMCLKSESGLEASWNSENIWVRLREFIFQTIERGGKTLMGKQVITKRSFAHSLNLEKETEGIYGSDLFQTRLEKWPRPWQRTRWEFDSQTCKLCSERSFGQRRNKTRWQQTPPKSLANPTQTIFITSHPRFVNSGKVLTFCDVFQKQPKTNLDWTKCMGRISYYPTCQTIFKTFETRYINPDSPTFFPRYFQNQDQDAFYLSLVELTIWQCCIEFENLGSIHSLLSCLSAVYSFEQRKMLSDGWWWIIHFGRLTVQERLWF